MDEDPGRRLRILGALRQPAPGGRVAARLCEVAAATTGASGAGIMVMSGDYPTGSICSSNLLSRSLEDLQYELGEGPCIDAYTSGRPILVPDLERESHRWSAFGHRAFAAGARSMFGFPMSIGAVRIGAMNLYRDRTSDLTGDEHADALVMADVAAHAVLVLQVDAAPGDLAAALADSDLHLVVHQAAGMVAVQLGVPIATALARLRARAFAEDRSLNRVSRDIVDRRVRFNDET